MLDLRYVCESLDEVRARFGARLKAGAADDLARVAELARERLAAIATAQSNEERANAHERETKALIARLGGPQAPEAQARFAEARALREQAVEARKSVDEVEARITALLMNIPNLPAADVPDGADESANVELAREGEPRRFDFTPRDHVDIGEKLGLLDLPRAAKLSGARFNVLTGALARLERALVQFMLDVQTGEHGYTEAIVPYLVLRKTMEGTGQLPKFEADLFRTDATGAELFLIPTAEVPLTNLYADEILDDAQLPIKLCAFSPCFRAEAGAAGRDTRGILRQHQFHKVELVQITRAEDSRRAQDEMVENARTILRRLDLPHRVMLLSKGDMGFAAARCCDIEVWLPGQGTYREISSVSDCTDFQARRAAIRRRDGKKNRLVHTLNGSGLAVGRTLIAVLENHQNADGSVTIPPALRPYMGGAERIGPAA